MATKDKYAVIKAKGSQYKVFEKDEILVDFLGKEKFSPKVLLLVDSGKVKIGKPELKGVKIQAKVIDEEVKGKKITVMKYKAKSRYRKKTGFRPKYTRVLIQKISS
jgi:large subunit ribosomal protein L21